MPVTHGVTGSSPVRTANNTMTEAITASVFLFFVVFGFVVGVGVLFGVFVAIRLVFFKVLVVIIRKKCTFA